MTEFGKASTIRFHEHLGEMNPKSSELCRSASGLLGSGRGKGLFWGGAFWTGHLWRNSFVSSVRPISERVAYVSELSTTEIALNRKKTTGVKGLQDEVRHSLRGV